MHASPRQRRCSRLLPVFVAFCAQLAVPPLSADEGNRFCGGATQPASPDDLDNAVGELSLQYVASQPSSSRLMTMIAMKAPVAFQMMAQTTGSRR